VNFETTVKLQIYNTIVETTETPTVPEVASALGFEIAEVAEAFQILSNERLLVLEPSDPNKIRMAPPFSGIKTIHRVKIGKKSYFANCAWDALGIAAAMQRDADIESSCLDCGEDLAFQVSNSRPISERCAVHFAVPAAKWWDDIIYT
jgi:hypothetical protein